MDTALLDRQGQLSIPRAILERLGIEPETVLVVETPLDGSIVLRPSGHRPTEIYSESRILEFLEGDRMTAEEAALVADKLGAR